ncbi:MAG: TMEM165/GDT1 family protein [Vicinamibacteria bacterium]
MDLRLVASVFSLVFIAELGDKTQLATMALVAGGKPRLAVFVGASLALIATTALGVLFGEAVTRVISPIWLKRVAGVGFLIMGALLLSGKA